MSLNVKIDTSSRREAEILAAELPASAEATSVRGYGLIKLRCRDRRHLQEVISSVGQVVEDHELPWARVRHGDDEHMFRGRVRRGG